MDKNPSRLNPLSQWLGATVVALFVACAARAIEPAQTRNGAFNEDYFNLHLGLAVTYIR